MSVARLPALGAYVIFFIFSGSGFRRGVWLADVGGLWRL